MRICIDSNQFIFGVEGSDPASEALMMLLPRLEVVIPRLVMKEVTRNLNDAQVKAFYALLNKAPRVTIIDEPVPTDLVNRYGKRSGGVIARSGATKQSPVSWQLKAGDCFASLAMTNPEAILPIPNIHLNGYQICCAWSA